MDLVWWQAFVKVVSVGVGVIWNASGESCTRADRLILWYATVGGNPC